MKYFSALFLALSLSGVPALAQEESKSEIGRDLANLIKPESWSRVVIVTKRGKDTFDRSTGIFKKNASYSEVSRKTVRNAEFIKVNTRERSSSLLLTFTDGSRLGVHFEGVKEANYNGYDWEQDPIYATKFKQALTSALKAKTRKKANELELSFQLDQNQKLDNVAEFFHNDGEGGQISKTVFPVGTPVVKATNLLARVRSSKGELKYELDLPRLISQILIEEQAEQDALQDGAGKSERIEAEEPIRAAEPSEEVINESSDTEIAQ